MKIDKRKRNRNEFVIDMNRIKGLAYRLGMFLVKWSGGPRAKLDIAHLPMREYEYRGFRERAALRGLPMDALPNHLLFLFTRESEAEIWRIKTSEDLFPNHK